MPEESSNWLRLNEWMADRIRHSEDAPASPQGAPVAERSEPERDYQVVLENVSRNMIRYKKPERLIKMIVRSIDEQVKLAHTAMLLKDPASGTFTFIDSRGEGGKKIPVGFIKLTAQDPLIRLFSEGHNYKVSDTQAVDYNKLSAVLKNSDQVKKAPLLGELAKKALRQMEVLKVNICIPVYCNKDLVGILLLGHKLSGNQYSRQELGFFTTLANDISMALANTQLIQDLQDKIYEIHSLYEREHNVFIKTSISLAAAIDSRDPYTHGHTERVTQYAMMLADELLEVPDAQEYKNFKETLQVAALLHDVGKVGVPDSILNKNGMLTKDEFGKVKEHPGTGAAILYPIRELGDIAREVRSHHERFDGGGYPDGLKNEEIPFISRIIAVADTFDAITSDRPYRQRSMAEVAAGIIKDNSGTQFDPLVVSAFLLAYRKGKFGSRG